MVGSVNSSSLAQILAQEQAALAARSAGAESAQTQAPTDGGQSGADPAVVYAGSSGAPSLSAILALTDSLNRAASISDVGVSAGQAIGSLLEVLKEKAAAARTATPDDKQALNADYQQALATIDQIANSASFQGVTMLNGGSGQDLTFKADLSGDSTISLAGQDLTSGGPVLGLAGTDILGSSGDIQSVLDQVDNAQGALAGQLDQMTAQSDQIQGHLSVVGQLQSALSGGASDSADAARLQALTVQQALTGGASSVANQAPQALLSLFRAS